jgi:hypothetical protein
LWQEQAVSPIMLSLNIAVCASGRFSAQKWLSSFKVATTGIIMIATGGMKHLWCHLRHLTQDQ